MNLYKKKQLKVVYAKWGLANNFGSWVEINHNLADEKHKPLRDVIIRHELDHKTSFDLKHEFKIPLRIMPSLIYFFITTPTTWVDILPVQIRKINGERVIIWDINLMIIYFFAIIFIVGAFYAARFLINL